MGAKAVWGTATVWERGRVPGRVSTCVWRCRPDVVLALAERFGPPVDAYVNGSQVWLRDDGPDEVTLEWRLHPVAGYRAPGGPGTHELFEVVADALATGQPPPAALEALWDGLEAFAAYGDEPEPPALAAACTRALGLPPDASGLVDHERIGDAWERADRRTSLTEAVLAELGAGPEPGS